MELEEWLKKTGSLALKELAEGGERMREMDKPAVMEHILAHPPCRARALESKRIEERALAWRATLGAGTVREMNIRFPGVL